MNCQELIVVLIFITEKSPQKIQTSCFLFFFPDQGTAEDRAFSPAILAKNPIKADNPQILDRQK